MPKNLGGFRVTRVPPNLDFSGVSPKTGAKLVQQRFSYVLSQMVAGGQVVAGYYRFLLSLLPAFRAHPWFQVVSIALTQAVVSYVNEPGRLQGQRVPAKLELFSGWLHQIRAKLVLHALLRDLFWQDGRRRYSEEIVGFVRFC